MASTGSRDVMLTKFIKVNDKKAIQMEIQMTLRESSQKNSNERIERKHLKEIADLLKDVIRHHVENENGKSKKTSTDFKILTGKMIRLGYMFKKKSENHTLLLSDDSDEEEIYVHSLKIYNEKLVVFYHLLDEDSHLGSTTAMSQIIRALNDGKLSQSYSGTVSISCYFQKKESASASTTNIQGGSSGKTKTTMSSEEKSEENQKADDHITNVEQKEKIAIKKIVQRSAPALGRRIKQRKKQHTESKGTDVNSLEDSNEGINQKHCSSVNEIKTDDCDENRTPESYWLSSDVDSPSCQDEGSPSKILVDSAYRDFTQRETDFSAKSSSGESFKCDIRTKTKSSLDLCNPDSCDVTFSDNSSCAVDTVFFKQTTSTVSKCENTSVESECEKICKPSTCTQASHNVQRFDSDSDLPDFSFLKRTRGSLLDKEEKLNIGLTTQNQNNMASEITERGTTSPIFDKKTRPLKRPLNSLDVSDDDSLNKDDGLEKRLKLKRQRVKKTLPEFPADNSEEKERHEAATEDFLSRDIPVNEWDGLPILASSRSSKKEKSEYQSKNADSHQKKEGKETDQSLPVMENLTTSIKQEKRVFSFKKSAEKSKRQSILSFLTLSEQEECYKDRSSEATDCQDSDSLDCVIIDGLDDLQEPEFRDEETSSIESKISCLQRVDELNEQHLHYLVKKHKAYLQDIFSGKIFSERHDVYKKGGKARKDLNHHVHLGLFTEEQLDVVMETLMSIFCKKHHKYLEYIMKVLLPEVLIKIYMTFHKMSHQEAEDDMLEAVKKPGGIHI